jgi:hypothetical protein
MKLKKNKYGKLSSCFFYETGYLLPPSCSLGHRALLFNGLKSFVASARPLIRNPPSCMPTRPAYQPTLHDECPG